MDSTINFGIDLGTTNSVIARFVKGEVQVYNNPMDQGRSSLPSVVGFKKDKIFTGAPARTLYEKDTKSVVSAFKRRMGTTESYKIKATGQSVTPVDLSAIVLKELKTFLPPGEQMKAAVITIPASFDTIQSNATKEAPIAASLAYSNMKKARELGEGQWLVYDLGGGTFDVALIRIKDNEMRVLDHEGDNFLGGTDFDRLIVEKLVIPKLEAQFSFSNLADQLQSDSGQYRANYQLLLRKAEEAKIALSSRSAAEIVVDGMEDEDGNEVDVEITITQSDFQELIKSAVDRTVSMVKEILTRNKLQPRDLLFTLMVGGSTFIPYVRQRVGESLGTPVNCDIDPTTAVAVGAAYYAGTKKRENDEATRAAKAGARLQVKTSYLSASREKEEMFSAKITGDLTGLSYRITRQDGGFDSGLKRLAERINEDLPLAADTFNMFRFVVYDGQNNVVETDLEDIAINSGFGISGQPLPEDICLEVLDDERPTETRLVPIFRRMMPLPAHHDMTRQLSRTIVKGSRENALFINVREGSQYNLPTANQLIGHIRIDGTNLTRDVQRGSDIEISVSMTESRELTVKAYLTMSDQEFAGAFTLQSRTTSVELTQTEAVKLTRKIDDELVAAEKREDYELAAELKRLRKEGEDLSSESEELSHDDVTDKKYQLEGRKRALAQRLHAATRDKHLLESRHIYENEKTLCQELVDECGNDQEQKYLRDIEALEPAAFSSGHVGGIQELTNKLTSIRYTILWRQPTFLTNLFNKLVRDMPRMNNPEQAERLVQDGRRALQNQEWTALRSTNQQLINLLPSTGRPDGGNGPQMPS
jgi:molecular chaperone DnaK